MSFLGDLLGSTTDSVGNYVQSPGLQSDAFSRLYGEKSDEQGELAQQLRGQSLNQQNLGQEMLNQTRAQDQVSAHAQQQALVNALRAQASGAGPSVSNTMLQQAMAQNAANSNALAASQHGVNAGLAMRQAEQSNAAANQASQAQSVVARQQEQMNAQNQLGGALNTMRAQSLQNQMGQQQLGLGAYGQSKDWAGLGLQANSQAKDWAGLGLQAAQSNLQGNMAAAGINAGISTGNTQGKNALTGSFLNALGGAAASGGGAAAAGGAAHGGVIPGKAQVQGDSYDNDTVPTMLSPGEIVVPRSKADDPAKAKEFIDHLMKSKGKSSQGGSGYGKVLEAHRKLQSRVAELEKKVGKAG